MYFSRGPDSKFTTKIQSLFLYSSYLLFFRKKYMQYFYVITGTIWRNFMKGLWVTN